MDHFDDDQATAGATMTAGLDDETELMGRAGAGDKQAFDVLYERYFARTSWYFAIFARRAAEAAVQEVLTELFGSLREPSEFSLAERAYRLSLATELRHAAMPKKAGATKVAIANVTKRGSSTTLPSQA